MPRDQNSGNLGCLRSEKKKKFGVLDDQKKKGNLGFLGIKTQEIWGAWGPKRGNLGCLGIKKCEIQGIWEAQVLLGSTQQPLLTQKKEAILQMKLCKLNLTKVKLRTPRFFRALTPELQG